jgi:hypothetical protein
VHKGFRPVEARGQGFPPTADQKTRGQGAKGLMETDLKRKAISIKPLKMEPLSLLANIIVVILHLDP